MKRWPVLAVSIGATGLVLFGLYRLARAEREPDEVVDEEPTEGVPPGPAMSPDTPITEHFQLKQFAQKPGPCQGIKAAPYPTAWVEKRLKPLCKVLEALRTALGGKTIKINSAYRSPLKQACVNPGVPGSQHVRGRAADIAVPGVSPKKVASTLLALYEQKKVDFGGLGLYKTFVHVDVGGKSQKTGRPRMWRG